MKILTFRDDIGNKDQWLDCLITSEQHFRAVCVFMQEEL